MYLLMSESKKECKDKKVWFMEDTERPLEAGMMCTIDGDSRGIHGLETQVHHAMSQKMILAHMVSPTSTSQSKVAPVLCLL